MAALFLIPIVLSFAAYLSISTGREQLMKLSIGLLVHAAMLTIVVYLGRAQPHSPLILFEALVALAALWLVPYAAYRHIKALGKAEREEPIWAGALYGSYLALLAARPVL